MQAYNSTDQILHQLSQVIAKVNKAFVQHQADDSHTNLYFDSVKNRITGRWIENGAGKYLLVFDLSLWEYQVLNERIEVIARVSQDSKTSDQSETELGEVLENLGFDMKDVLRPLHFEIPKYSFLVEKIQKPDTNELKSWSQIRGQANFNSLQFLGHIQRPSEIRIWPHHFDTGVYVEVNAEVGVGFGLAMADGMIDSPYYYLAGYSLGEKSWGWDTTPTLQTGKWIKTEGWKGAVLPLSDTTFHPSELAEFISVALSWYLQ